MGSLASLHHEFDIRSTRLLSYFLSEPQSFVDWGSQAMGLKTELSTKWFSGGSKLTSKVLYHVFGNSLDSGAVRRLVQDASVLSLIFDGVFSSVLSKNPVAVLMRDQTGRVALGYFDYVLGLNEHLVDAYENYIRLIGASDELDLNSFWRIVSGNPYRLSILDYRFTLEEMDTLALFFGYSLLNLPDDLRNMRMAALVHSRVVGPTGLCHQSSLLGYSDFMSSGFPLFCVGNDSYSVMRMTTFWLDADKLSLLSTYFGVSRERFDASYLFSLNWVSTKSGMCVYDNTLTGYLLQVYRVSNLGYAGALSSSDTIPAFIGDLFNLYRESYLAYWSERASSESWLGYKRMGSDRFRYFLREFEGRVGFTLEPEQVAVKDMLKHQVFAISGVAGSGKTTIAAYLYRYLKACGLSQQDIAFCAPTGKAAARIREVVGVPAFTLHSYFRLASDGTSTLPLEPVHTPTPKVLIIDECSMINLSVFYEVIRSIPTGTQLILIGDFHQLPPIGVGCFFADILQYIPTVHLSVSKRAAESSGLVRNSSRVLAYSGSSVGFGSVGGVSGAPDGTMAQGASGGPVLCNEPDVRVTSIQVPDLRAYLSGLVRRHVILKESSSLSLEEQLSGSGMDERFLLPADLRVEPADFQIITPFRKYEYGVDALNPVLQDLLNPVSGLHEKRVVSGSVTESVFCSFSDGGFRCFRLGDRVIHTSNQPRQLRYIYDGSSFDRVLSASGVMNGDVGYVRGIFRFKTMRFTGPRPLNIDNDALVLAVEYTDVDSLGRDYAYCILYPLSMMHRGGSYWSGDTLSVDLTSGVEVHYGGLAVLDLAYALTVHKMQGSQAKLVIFLLYPAAGNNSDFISRNLVYTGITRASDAMYVLGDVGEGSYVLDLAMQTDALRPRLTLLGFHTRLAQS